MLRYRPMPDSAAARAADLEELYRSGAKKYGQADYQGALADWERGLEAARESGHRQAIGAFAGNIGVLYGALGDYPKALDHYQAST